MTTGNQAGEVKLLSGGNPQIPKGDGDGPVRAYIAAMPGWKGDIGRHIDHLATEGVPELRRAVRWNSPFYGVEGNGWFLSYHCFTRCVQITWLNGSLLDPPPPKTSRHEHVRYVEIHEDEAIDDRQLRDWIRQAASMPGEETF